jgi:hypothetical protein
MIIYKRRTLQPHAASLVLCVKLVAGRRRSLVQPSDGRLTLSRGGSEQLPSFSFQLVVLVVVSANLGDADGSVVVSDRDFKC